METERIALSQRERDRLRVLHEVKQKQITQIEAARRLKVMVSGPAAGKAPALPLEIPPPLPVAVLPVMVTWVRVASQVNPGGQLAGAKLLI